MKPIEQVPVMRYLTVQLRGKGLHSDAEERAPFQKLFRPILPRMKAFASLPFASLPLWLLDKNAIQAGVAAINNIPV